MEFFPYMGIAVLVYYAFIKWMDVRSEENARQHELNVLKIMKLEKYSIVNLATCLMKDVKEDNGGIDAEEKELLITNLQIIVLNMVNDKPDESQLKKAKDVLFDVMNKGNLTVDVVAKLKQLFDIFQL